jgi:hypothetical protein
MREKVEFPPNTPVAVVLAYDSPLEAPSKRGGPLQYAYSLQDEKIMYMDEDPHRQIQSSGAKRGDALEITRKVARRAGRDALIGWEVIHVDTDYQPGDPEGYPDTVDDDDRDDPNDYDGEDRRPTRKAPPAPTRRAAPTPTSRPATKPATNGNASTPTRSTRNASTPQPPIRVTQASVQMCAALCAAIDAAAEAEVYARRKGMALEFQSEDIRTIAATLFIQHHKDGGK